MILSKPKFWDKKINIISIILLPFTLIFLIFIFLRKKFIKSVSFEIPIICVGNVYIGGTGKTPTSIILAAELLNLGRKPVILRKYYRSHSDEYEMIKNNFKNIILCKKRIEGITNAVKQSYDSVILDDGFQDYSVNKNLNIVCFNGNQLIGNGLVLPAGPLRESLNSLQKANIIIINGEKNENFEAKILKINKNLRIFYSYYKPLNLASFKNKKLLAVVGIGNPENFFSLLKENNLNVEEQLIFPDHYEFSKKEAFNIIQKAKHKDYKIITTEKNYFKLKNYSLNDFNYLKVSLEIKKKELLIEQINELYKKNN